MGVLFVSPVVALGQAQPGGAAPVAAGSAQAPLDWRTAESRLLSRHTQLTARDQFIKAGEAYFSPDGRSVIFQATAVPEAGKDADPFYAMYVASLDASSADGPRLTNVRRVSPSNTANTCGWFHPTDPHRVIFGSTMVRPADEQKSGFQVGSRRYVWMFPSEMEVVSATVQAGTPSTDASPIFARPNYDAECSFDKSGRFLLYAHIEDAPNGEEHPKPDANIYIYDTATRKHTPIVVAPGYDGGPFFSPDGRSICYRSDRKGNDLLQLYVADLKFEKDAAGVECPVGIEREYQLTDNGSVNWAPYWHPSGKFLIYGTSEVSHANYEVFAIEVDRAKMKAAAAGAPASASAGVAGGTVVVPGLRRERITSADGADVLPVFSADGAWMMWTSQRGPKAAGEEKSSSQLWIVQWKGGESPFSPDEGKPQAK